MKNLIEVFEANSKKAMKESEKAIGEKNWVKSERKETEAETWQEAARLLKRQQAEIKVPTDAEISHHWKRKNCFGQYLEGLEYGAIWMRDELLSAKTEA